MISFIPTSILGILLFLVDCVGGIIIFCIALVLTILQLFSDAFFALKSFFLPKKNNHEDEIIIVGAGASGLAAAARLKQEGFTNIKILEKYDKVGGTWLVNKYPGCACDVPSPVYQFNFFTRPFSEFRSTSDSCEDYFGSLVLTFGLKKFLHFSHDVSKCEWNGSEWIVSGKDLNKDSVFTFKARFLFMCTGILRDQRFPNVRGKFDGKSFHTSQWDSSVDLKGKSVCVVGTGASGVQVIPEIAPVVKHLYVFQSSASWVFKWSDVSRIEKLPSSILSLICSIFSSIYPFRLLLRMFYFLQLESLVLIGIFERINLLRTAVEKMNIAFIRSIVKNTKLHEHLIPKVRKQLLSFAYIALYLSNWC